MASFAQDVSGVWTGYMYNDTTGQKMYYELAINEMKEKATDIRIPLLLLTASKILESNR